MTDHAVRPIVIDLGLAAVTVVAVLVGTVFAGHDLTYAGTFPVATSLGLLLLVRRRWPLTVLLASVAIVMAFRMSELTEVGWVWPASVAYLTVAVATGRRGRSGLRWAIGVGVFQLVSAGNWEWTVLERDAQHAYAGVGAEALWLALLIAVALAYRNWLRWRSELAAGLTHAEQERKLDADRRAAEERLQIARELHDLVAHTLTVVGVQLRVVDEALDDSPAEARDALRTAQEVRTKAVTDLRSLIGVLREPGESPEAGAVPEPQADLDKLDDLVDRTRASGLDLVLDVTGDPATIPAPVALAAYRIVQESLTNTVRHANAARVTLRLRYNADEVRIEVIDDGAGPDPRALPGHGISGMRERVAALGGTFSAGPAGGGPAGGGPAGDGLAGDGLAGVGPGYAVRVTIPVADFRS